MNKKYQVDIPPAKSKRLINKTVIIQISTAWSGSHTMSDNLVNNENVFVFELPESVKWAGKPSGWCDADIFTVSVEYSSPTSDRTERVDLTPKEI